MSQIKSQTKSRFAVAALLAALSVPTFASDAASCSVCDDPTQPLIERPAPAIALGGGAFEAAVLAADPTWPATDVVSPAIALTHEPGGVQIEGPAEHWTPAERYAIELGAGQTQRVAKAR